MADYYLDSVTGSDADNGTTRALAEATLTAALGDMSAGDRLFVEDGHTENPGATTTYTFPGSAASPCQVICVDFAGTADPNPPVSADLRTGGDVTMSGNFSLAVRGGPAYIYGVDFFGSAGGGSGTLSLADSDAVHYLVFDSCSLGLVGTQASLNVLLGTTSSAINAAYVRFRSCTFTFGATTQRIAPRAGRFIFEQCTFAATGSVPATLFIPGADSGGYLTFLGCDFSAIAGNMVTVSNGIPQTYEFVECRLGSSVTIANGTQAGAGGIVILLYNCDSGDTHYRNEQHDYGGTAVTVTDVVRSSGFTAQPEGVAVARRVTTSANVSRFAPWRADGPMLCVGWFSSTGSKTVTLYFIHGQSAALTNAEIWLELEYLGTSGFPQAVLANDAPADVLASSASQTATSSIDWDDGATARANSTAYSIGDIRRAATPNGRLFICTTGGTSHSSEPAAFATAADGDSVSEGSGTVVWRCMRRQSLDVTVTVNEVGAVIGRVHIGRASTDVWFCPKMEGVEQNPVNFTTPYGPALSLVAAASGGGSKGDGTGMFRHINRIG